MRKPRDFSSVARSTSRPGRHRLTLVCPSRGRSGPSSCGRTTANSLHLESRLGWGYLQATAGLNDISVVSESRCVSILSRHNGASDEFPTLCGRGHLVPFPPTQRVWKPPTYRRRVLGEGVRARQFHAVQLRDGSGASRRRAPRWQSGWCRRCARTALAKPNGHGVRPDHL